MTKDPSPRDGTTAPKPPAKVDGEPDTYIHEPAGIRERSGSIPVWLKLVTVGLLLWGIYYTIRYWSSY